MNDLPHDSNPFLGGEDDRPAFSLSIYRLLSHYADTNGNTFLLAGNPVPSQTVFSPEMLLPVVALEAMRIWQTIERPANDISYPIDPLDESLGLTFMESETSFFPLSVQTPSLTQDITSSLRLLCFNLASRRVFALQEGESIDLEPLLEEWKHIDWYAETISDIPVPKDFNSNFMRNEFSQQRVVSLPTLSDKPSPF